MKSSLLLIAITLFSSQSFAQEDVAVTDPVSVVDESDASSKEVKARKMIEEKYKLSPEEISKYRGEKLGYGQIMVMAEITKKSGRSTDEMLALLKEKKTVREVAKEMNFSKDDLKRMRAENQMERKEFREQKREEHRVARREERRKENRENKMAQRQENSRRK